MPRKKTKPIVKCTPAVKAAYLKRLGEIGREQECADVAGVSLGLLREHMKKDPEFAAAVEVAKERYRDRIEAEIYRRGVEGVETPVFGKDGQVGIKITYSDRMLELHAKRHIAAYRDQSRIDHNVQGGVLVVPGLALNSREWEDGPD
jgi:hypothetical protein